MSKLLMIFHCTQYDPRDRCYFEEGRHFTPGLHGCALSVHYKDFPAFSV